MFEHTFCCETESGLPFAINTALVESGQKTDVIRLDHDLRRAAVLLTL